MVFSAIPQVVTEDRASGAQFIEGSLKFDGGYLTRTPTSVGNRKTFTWSAWIKRSDLSSRSAIWGAGTTNGSNNPGGSMYFNSSTGTLQVVNGGGTVFSHVTSASHRDTGWYHVVIAINTSGTPRVAIYINGEQATASGTIASSNFELDYNNTIIHAIGSRTDDGALPASIFKGHMSQVYLIDGQALGPENFGYTDPLTNTWRPKKYTRGVFEELDKFNTYTFGEPQNQLRYQGIKFPSAAGGTVAWKATGSSNTGLNLYTSTDNSNWTRRLSNQTVDSTNGLVYESSDQYVILVNGSDTNWSNQLQLFSDVNGATIHYSNGTYPGNGNPTMSWSGPTYTDGTIASYNSFYLPMDGNTPIGKDQSGNGNDWTPVNFGGSLNISKATGAIPILNTNEAGTVGKPGVRTDKKTYTVTASGGNYYLDGALKPTLNAYRGGSYTFDYTGATSHPFYLSSLPDGKHNSNAYSVAFNGSGQYLTHPNDDTITDWSSGDYTIELWAYFNSFTLGANSNTHLIGAAAIDVGSESWSLGPNSSGQVVWYYWNGSQQRVTGGTITTGRWYHLAMTHSGGAIRIFIDGKLSTTGSVNGTPQTSTLPLRIGKITQTNSFNGYVSNVRIVRGSAVYTSDFTPPQTTLTNITNTTFLACQSSDATTATVAPGTITATGAAASQSRQPFLYDNNHGNFGVNTGTSNTTKITIPHLAADTLYYYCNVHSGMGSSINVTTDIRKADPYAWKNIISMPLNSAVDESGNINVNQTSQTVTNSSTSFTGLSNFYGSTASFSRSSANFLSIPDSAGIELGNDDFTIEFWLYLNNTTYHYEGIISKPGNSDAQAAPMIYKETSGNIHINFSETGSNNWNIGQFIGNCAQLAFKWHHVAVTRAGNTFRWFLDGVMVKTQTSSNTLWNNGNPLYIGKYTMFPGTNTYGFDGYLQDFRFYKGVAKYLGNIGDQVYTPASTSPDILPDTPSGITGKTNLAKITDGAVALSRSPESHLILPTSNDLAPESGDFTIETFIYANSFDNYPVMWDTRVTGYADTNGFFLGINNAGRLYMYDNGNTRIFYDTLALKKWHHIALVRKNNDIKMYVDGIQRGSTYSRNHNFPNQLKFIGDSTSTEVQVWQFNGFFSNYRFTKGQALYDGNFDVPTEPLTATSQGATGSNVKLLACQSNTSAVAAAVAPGTFVNDGTNYSSGNQVTGSAGLRDVDSIFDGHLRLSGNPSLNEAATVNISSDNYILWTPTTGIPYTSKVEVYCYAANGYEITNYYTFNGGTETTFTGGASNFNGNAWITVATGSGTINSIKLRITRGSGNQTQVNWYAVRVDGTVLINDYSGKSLAKIGNAAGTNFNPFTDDINTIRGQASGYATINPLYRNPNGAGTLSNGNLTHTTAAGNGQYNATLSIKPNTGKFYWEVTKQTSSNVGMIGITDMELSRPEYNANNVGSFSWYIAGPRKQTSGVDTNYGSSVSEGDVIGVAYDSDARELRFYLNGMDQGVAFDSSSIGEADYFPAFSAGSSTTAFTYSVNFGQKPFKFSPPDGFQPLNLSNVQPEKVIARPDQYFGLSLWSGNGTSQNITGLKHKPDFVWIKKRAGGTARSHQLFDSVRGVYKTLHSDSAGVEDNNTNRLTAFNHDGFAVGGDDGCNGSSGTFVSWTWKAGGDKNTFNIDDVGYANASDVNMNVGLFNNYNTSRVWSSGIANSSGDFDQPATNAFNGDRSNKLRTGGNSVLVTLNFSPALTVANTIEILGEDYATANFRYTVTVDGTTTTKDVDQGQPATFNVSGSLTQITFDNNNSNGRTYLEWIKVDGKELIDSNITPPNVPSIAPTGCSVNTKSKFGIYTYTGSGSGRGTLSHGLEGTPGLVIYKKRNSSSSWQVYHQSLGGTVYNTLDEDVGDYTGDSTRFGGTNPTSSIITLGTHANGADDTIMYAWCDVPGLQKFGKWTGINNTDGTFVELGFRPALVIAKESSATGAGAQWFMLDSSRNTYNPLNNILDANREVAERQGVIYDFLSTGFKIRTTFNSGGTFIYMAWAEAPSFNLYGAQTNAR